MSILEENNHDTATRRILDELKEKIFCQKNIVSENMDLFFKNKFKYVVFISASDGKSRAYVSKGIGNSIETSWKNAVDLLMKKIKIAGIEPIWFNAELVQSIKKYNYPEFIQHITDTRTHFFREGISFDDMFNIAFLEQEMNANSFIHKIKIGSVNQKKIAWENINAYLKRSLGTKYELAEGMFDTIYSFTTIGYFHDGEKCYELCNEGLDKGRRSFSKLDESLVRFLIERPSDFLSSQIDETGKFFYGCFPCFDKPIPTYNILRHASTTYSMIEAYEYNRSKELENGIKRSLEYLVQHGIRPFTENNGTQSAFVIERLDDNQLEIKLGANSAALLAFAKFTKVFSDNKYMPLMKALAEGIRFFQNKEDGSFVHILNFPELTVKEKHRIIYYDGEAAFSLMRLYDIDKDDRWLKTVEKSFDYFIKNNYWKNHDHWLSYCSFELMKYKPDKRYVVFNLQNADGILDYSMTREITFPTMLELFMATYCMIATMKRENIFLETLESFDYNKLINAIENRAHNQINGMYFPEVAMYFKSPEKILWSFYLRNHSFRSRIDDNAHNLSGYCSYLRNRLGIDPPSQ